MNLVAINLAHDIITGKMTVGEARDEYTRLGRAPFGLLRQTLRRLRKR